MLIFQLLDIRIKKLYKLFVTVHVYIVISSVGILLV